VMSGDPSNTPVRATNTGIKKKALKTFTTVSYSTELNLPSLDSECVICLSEFTNGDKVRLLPKCNQSGYKPIGWCPDLRTCWPMAAPGIKRKDAKARRVAGHLCLTFASSRLCVSRFKGGAGN
jgi:hypothetical protein